MHGWEGALSLLLTATSACAARTASLPPLGACPLWHLSVVITGSFLCIPKPWLKKTISGQDRQPVSVFCRLRTPGLRQLVLHV